MSRKSFLEKQKENVVATYLQQQLLCCCRETSFDSFFFYIEVRSRFPRKCWFGKIRNLSSLSLWR